MADEHVAVDVRLSEAKNEQATEDNIKEVSILTN